MALLSILVLLLGAGSVSAASWPSEAAMANADSRNTFIYAPAKGAYLSRADLLQYADYYDDRGFDENFIRWEPESRVGVTEAAPWASCRREPHTGPCPDELFNDYHAVTIALGGGDIRVIGSKDVYIALVCGNYTQRAAPGPVPTIRGTKYEDLNANGRKDGDEPVLSGWTMRLLFEGREVATTTTGADGGYEFRLDATRFDIGEGTYEVVEVLKDGWIQEESPAPFRIDHGVGARTYDRKDFGNYRPATIAGSKFHDMDVDGVWDALEPGLLDWTIGISPGGSQLTGRDGGFSFSVEPGTYTLQERLQEGWRQTTPLGDGTRRYTVISGQVVDNADFGNVCLGEVSVKPVDDSTGLPLTGVEIRIEEVSVPDLIDNDPALPRTTTGTPDFGDLLPGTYRVIAFLPDDVYTTDDDLTLVDRRFAIVKQVTVKPCETTELPLRFFTQSRGKVTGGQVRFDLGDGFATSGFTFRTHRDGPRGTLQFNDHSRPSLKLHTREIGGIAVDDDGVVAHVWGDVDVDGASLRFHLRLVDAGEPGVDDRYELTLENGYRAGFSVTLSGGNVQIHG